MGLEAVV